MAPGLVVVLAVSGAWAQGRASRRPMQVVPAPPPVAPPATVTATAATATATVVPTAPTPTFTLPTMPTPTATTTTPGLGATPGGVPSVGGAPVTRDAKAEARLTRLMPVTGGLTADQAGARARTNSYDVAAKNESLRAAAARVDQATVNFIPRLTGTARYTRLSRITPPVLGVPGVYSVSAVGPGAQPGQPVDTTRAQLIATPGFSFPVILDNYLLQASLAVPISDYFLRIIHAHSAATHNEEAARLDKLASEAKAISDGKIQFYNWVKAIGQREVLQQALEATREHAKDADALFKAGSASKADLLAVQAQVAQGELAVAQANEFVELAYEQLRLAVRAREDETLALGEDVISALPPMTVDATALRQEASSQRAELRSLAAAEVSLQKFARVSRAGAWPQLVAAGNYTYANPNQRIFPQTDKFNGTWDASIQLSWSPNDFFAGRAAGSEADANAARLTAQRGQLRDGLMLEVTQAATNVKTADASAEAAMAGLVAAEEAYRVRKEMFRVGRATSVELTDSETNLFRAKLATVTARIDQRISRVRLEHSVGRDLAKIGAR